MAASVSTPAGAPSYALVLSLAYVLIILSLWTVDSGLVEQQSGPSRGDIGMTSLAPPQYHSRSHRQTVYVEDIAFGSWGANQIRSDDEEVRRKTTLALMVYATGNGIRR